MGVVGAGAVPAGSAPTGPVVLAANQPADRFYAGGARVAEFRGPDGAPADGDHVPEDWVGSATTLFGEDALGLTRLPSYYLTFNQAWCIAVAIAADLLAWLRLLTLDHHPKLTKATPDTLRDLLNVPARLVHHARRRLLRLPTGHPHAGDLTHAWQKIRVLPT